jgi:gliding motility-associated-like protein
MLTITGLSAGLYSANVTDAIGVPGSASVTINEPALFTATRLSTQDKLCFGDANGSVTFDIVGGTAPYTIAWTEGSTPRTEIVNVPPFKATNVAPGTYNFTISDASTCAPIVINSIVLADPQKLNITNIVGVNINCNSDANGSITVTSVGGTTPLNYTIAGPINTSVPDGVFNNLLPGDYTVSLTDANGCVASSDVLFTVTLVEPSPLSLTFIKSLPLNCPDEALGFLRPQVSGGTPNYTYNWSNGSTSPDLVDIVVGDYTLEITDAKGCKLQQTEHVDGPLKFVITDTTITPAKCSQILEIGKDVGSIKLTSITGGTPPFTHLWNFPVSSPVTGDFINELSGGKYAVTTTDANGCIYHDTIEVKSDPDYFLEAFASDDMQICGSATVNLVAIENGLNPARTYTYSWYEVPNTSGPILGNQKTFTVNPTVSTQYYLEIRNDGGCLSSDYVNIDIYPKIGLEVPLYIPSVQHDTIISVVPGTLINLDVITESTLYPTDFKWKPEFLFYPDNSWNSYFYIDKEKYSLIPPERLVKLRDPDTQILTDYILVDVYATTSVGCKDSLKLYIKQINKVSFGNVFSPNGDGINDKWEIPKDYLFPDLEIEIFDRWGARVWSAKGKKAAEGWNGRTDTGKDLPIGTYYYIVKYNIQVSDGWKPETGSVTIVR